METKQAKKPAAPKLVYVGKQIFLSGIEGAKDEIIVFQHTYQDGSTENIGLRMNTVYQVGGKDVNGRIIKDWVYESFLSTDINPNRKLSESEMRSEENAGDEGPCDLSL